MSSDRKTKILLVDDEKMLLELYSIKFAKGGFDVVTCSSAEQALSLLKQGYEPEIILFDISMPEMSGYEFMEKLNTERIAKKSLKLALTNESQDGERDRIVQLGAGHIVKAEFTPGELVEKIAGLLSGKKS